MIEGVFIPLLAKERWQAINVDTDIQLVPAWATRYRLIVPLADDASVFSLRWWPEEEEVVMRRVVGLAPIQALGYGPKSDTLLIGVPERWKFSELALVLAL